MEFIKDNYLRVYGSGADFRYEVDPPKDRNIGFHDACKSVAQEVYTNKQGKLYLMYSGGVDSEYILSLFLSLGMDITPVIVRLNPNYNLHDIQYAIDFCESKKLKPIIYDIDFDDFVKTGKILDVAKACQCGAYQLPSTFHAVSQLDGTIVMGSHGPTHITKFETPGGVWVVDELERLHSVLNHFEVNKINGCPFFLAHTAEQYYSFLIHPTNKSLAEDKYMGRMSNNFIKGEMFNQLSGFNMPKRPKFTGYENIEKSEIFQHENIQWFETVGKKWHGSYSVNYFELVNQLNLKK